MQSTLLIAFSTLPCDLQMWMNVLEALIGVIGMQLVTTLKEVTPALATVDTEGMDFIAQVYMSIIPSLRMEVATTTVVAELHVHLK